LIRLGIGLAPTLAAFKVIERIDILHF
jgi:hypothetical protein